MKKKNKTFQERKVRAQKIARKLKALYNGENKTALNYKTPWQLLVATILSAQCTDKRVNYVTDTLFEKHPNIEDIAVLHQKTLEKTIRSTGFYRNKARHIKQAAQKIIKEQNGKVPDTMDELLELPGVARKTANVVLGNAFGHVEGIAVDTHVRRLARKFNLTDEKSPDNIERDLMELLPKDMWWDFSNQLIFYGRDYCGARKHECGDHPLTTIYPKAADNWPRSS